MIKIRSINDPQLGSIPPPYRAAVERAAHNLWSTVGPDSQPEDQGFVVFVEGEDEPSCVNSTIGKNLSISLEGVFRDDSCLVGVVLFGNSGSGVTIVCPETEGHAPKIADILRSYL